MSESREEFRMYAVNQRIRTLLAAVVGVATAGVCFAQDGGRGALEYREDNALVFPEDYRSCPFVGGDVAEPLPAEAAARCVQCHTEHGAVERTFVQFYATLLEVARAKRTLRPGH